ncbi:LysR family transcriptional regulator [Companilactobacillus alimentarius]|uniref:LysR family transcriptional regulator n=1 Tax=Companilactobacillus alimentarius DSM 20249 TaxID=1423720 RepID=A0A2K9HIE8_9LACO|nr:LysR family transcriptional regulator [Companilactobacillus alimentarius]AUI72331.1 LysR family transcriptional regulator [Companilactobacillus alimentarius DSM 20249]KRK76649.1 fhu operon transcription regulator [Companilactobacillus alimentarius DSM 20249]MDT6952912.1 LysR family transcriptional regulator [Companilactobacillus alimentarius]GEO45899.1 transcriptional regulator [Companilactobacillus alimentarius]
MDVRVLRYFIIIAQEQNISRAARLLHVSQPALSRQIADLETTLGTKLFIRGKRQLQLTQDGYYLLEQAKEIVGLVNKTTYNLQKKDVISGSLDIGSGESIALKCVMQTIKEIMHKYPEIHINFRSGDGDTIKADLDSGILEFGIIMGQKQLTNYHTLVLPQRNRWGVIMRKDEQLAKQKEIYPRDLIGRPILISRQIRGKKSFQDWSKDLFDQLNFVGTYNLIFNAGLLVETGACIALTYEDLVDTTSNKGLVFRPLAPELTDPNTVIWSKNRTLPTAAKLFLDTLQKNIKETGT